MIKTLLLDLDGTLIDSRADLTASVNEVLKHLGQPVQTVDEVVLKIGNGLRRLIMETVGLTGPEELEKAKDIFTVHYDEHCTDETRAYPGVMDVLKSFHGRVRMAVVTNKPKAFADKILRHLEMDGFIEVVLGGDSLPQSKPDPAPLLDALQSLEGEPRWSLMVGDGVQDLKAGHAAGVATCLARYGFGYQPELMDLKPNHTIDEFQQLKEIVLCQPV